MSKAIIVGEHGSGLYTIEHVYDTAGMELAKANALVRLAKSDAAILTIEAEILIVDNDISAINVARNIAINDDDNQLIKELTNEYNLTIALRSVKNNALAVEKSNNANTSLQIGTMTAAISKYNSPIAVSAWCADYKLALTGEVDVINVNWEFDANYVIAPQGTLASEFVFKYEIADNVIQQKLVPALDLQPIESSGAYNILYNRAMLPALQKYKPQYRVGSIGSQLSVSLPSKVSTVRNYDSTYNTIVNAEFLQDVTMNYMGNIGPVSYPFEVGDDVIVRTTGSDHVVIGFLHTPKDFIESLVWKTDPLSSSPSITQGATSYSVMRMFGYLSDEFQDVIANYASYTFVMAGVDLPFTGLNNGFPVWSEGVFQNTKSVSALEPPHATLTNPANVGLVFYYSTPEIRESYDLKLKKDGVIIASCTNTWVNVPLEAEVYINEIFGTFFSRTDSPQAYILDETPINPANIGVSYLEARSTNLGFPPSVDSIIRMDLLLKDSHLVDIIANSRKYTFVINDIEYSTSSFNPGFEILWLGDLQGNNVRRVYIKTDLDSVDYPGHKIMEFTIGMDGLGRIIAVEIFKNGVSLGQMTVDLTDGSHQGPVQPGDLAYISINRGTFFIDDPFDKQVVIS